VETLPIGAMPIRVIEYCLDAYTSVTRRRFVYPFDSTLVGLRRTITTRCIHIQIMFASRPPPSRQGSSSSRKTAFVSGQNRDQIYRPWNTQTQKPRIKIAASLLRIQASEPQNEDCWGIEKVQTRRKPHCWRPIAVRPFCQTPSATLSYMQVPLM